MDGPKPGVDLERELTCSICTELLYRPLTLLDCLHTFCGACLKEWFSWQATAAEDAPTPPAPGASVFTCPSCRAAVRDTRHNATYATLLDMLLTAQPDKAKPEAEKEEMDSKYKPGDQVLPRLRFLERTPEQRRRDSEDRRLVAEVREMSLRDAVGGSSSGARPRSRRRDSSRTRDSRARTGARSRDPSRDSGGTSDRAAREHRQRNRRRAEQTANISSGPGQATAEFSEARRRQIEHQSSIRSLISSSDVGSVDIQREIEDFARQIQEEGLLDGLDLDNLDLSNNDELSKKITEAYRRRQRGRSRHEPARRSNVSSHSHVTTSDPPPPPESRARRAEGNSIRASSRPRSYSHSSSHAPAQAHHSRNSSAASQSEERSRPPTSNTPHSTHLTVQEEPRRRRRRTNSEGRSATIPVSPTQRPSQVTTRSQTDLTLRPNTGSGPSGSRSSSTAASPRPRSSSSLPIVDTSAQGLRGGHGHGSDPDCPQPLNLHPRSPLVDSPRAENNDSFEARARRAARPADIIVGPRANFAPLHSAEPSPSGSSVMASSPGFPQPSPRLRPEYFPEPSINCSRCGKEHIEYEIHYNCAICRHGDWNICRSCFRAGKGCEYWFGFGYSGYERWELARSHAADKHDFPEPHILTANRYIPPKIIPGGAEGRRTLTPDDPELRLQSGTFCARCSAWANECYWRCDNCNSGDWGFCNNCVNQGLCCSHPLLPLTHEPRQRSSRPSPPPSPGVGRPRSATVVASPGSGAVSSFRTLTFNTKCDVCRNPIVPIEQRFHCFECTGEGGGGAGDYDICQTCYARLTARGDISAENGASGWRRCLRGHRMVVVGFQDGRGGQLRHVFREIVGGRRLRIEAAGDDEGVRLQKWSISSYEGQKLFERLVTAEVRDSVPLGPKDAAPTFPPERGLGWTGAAKFAWYPAEDAEDELMFPKFAEVSEVSEVNESWLYGVYMGTEGLVPERYLVRYQDEGET